MLTTLTTTATECGKIMLDIEYHEQILVVQWLEQHGIFFTASANGARTSLKQGIKLKRMGCKKGSPDLFVLEPRKKMHGLFVELKRPETVYGQKGYMTDSQKGFKRLAEERGYAFECCYGYEDAVEKISSYLGIEA